MDQDKKVSTEATAHSVQDVTIVQEEVIDSVSEVAKKFLAQKNPIKLSKFLELNTAVPLEMVLAFEQKALQLATTSKRTGYETQWVNDWVVHSPRLRAIQQQTSESREQERPLPSLPEGENRDSDGESPTDYEDPNDDERMLNLPKIRLNELVLKPDVFDGVKPQPRRWIDDYERAARANGWGDALRCRYLPTFLTKAALDWFVTIGEQKVGRHPKWHDMKQAFIRHYLGDADKTQIRREIERTIQGERESSTSFIPRILRLFKLVDPEKSEESLVDCIRDKLRPEYQEKLSMYTIYSLEELNDLCLKVEAGRAAKSNAPRAKQQSQSGDRSTQQSYNNRQSSNREGGQSERKCYRCGRYNHISADCYSKFHSDGHELAPKARAAPSSKPRYQPKSQATVPKQVNAIVGDQQREDSTDPKDSQPSTSAGVLTLGRVRPAGQGFIQMLVNNSLDGFITHPVVCDEHEVIAIIDTGASSSVVSMDVATTRGWTIKPTSQVLAHAGGASLDCVGEIMINMQIKIGSKSVATTHTLVVIRDLVAPMVMGIDLMRIFKLTLDFTASKPLAFSKSVFFRGVRATETAIVPARSAKLIEVAVASGANLIATIPFNFDPSIIIPNSVNEVKHMQTKLLLVNTDVYAVEIRKGQQVASYEELSANPVCEEYSSAINSVIQLEGSGSTIKVGSDLSNDQIGQLSRLLETHKQAFSLNGELGFTTHVEHRIDLEQEAQPFKEKLRRHPLPHLLEAQKQVRNMLEQEVIEPSDSPWANEYVIVKKHGGGMRFCIDFRRLNALTRKDSYPLPNAEECLDRLAGQTYFSQLDMAAGYWQLPVAVESRPLTAFRVTDGHYQFKRLPFGLCNAPATFQRLVNALFAGLKGVHLQAFLDDLCIASTTFGEHVELLAKIFKILIKAGLKLKPEKCSLASREVTFLGHRITRDGIKPDPSKVDAIVRLPSPKDVGGVRRVLGAFGYYSKFIPNFAEITNALVKLMRKDVVFEWKEEHEKSFVKLKQELAKQILLTHMRREGEVILKTDGSLSGVAGLLLQQQDGLWRLVACCSRQLKPAEKNYPVTEIEALAIIHSLSKFRHYLIGRPFTILTDHHALCALNSKTLKNARVQRWSLILSEFDFQVAYRSGKLHADVDCLSRAPPEGEDEYLQTILSITVPTRPIEWTRYEDEESKEVLKQAKDGKGPFSLVNGVIYRARQLYVPLHKRDDIIQETHGGSIHDGIKGTLDRMKDYWWPELVQDVKRSIAACDACLRRKVVRDVPPGIMQPHESFRPMQMLAFDYVGPLPETLRHKQFIAVAIDHFTKFVVAKAMKDQSAEKFAKFFCEIVAVLGIPECVNSDNAKNFDNKLLSSIEGLFGTRHQFSVPGHSKGNAICERVIQSVEDKISLCLLSNQDARLDWELALPSVVMAINSKKHKTTGYSPFELMLGREPPQIQTSTYKQHTVADLHVQVLRHNLERMAAEAVSNSDDAHQRAKRFVKEREREIRVGEKVLIKVKSRSRKLGPKFEGPYTVMSRDRDIYTLRRVDNSKDVRRRHVSQLKLFVEPLVVEQKMRRRASINLLICVSLMTAVVCAAATKLQTGPKVIWAKTGQHVSLGSQTLPVEVHLAPPCHLIEKYAIYLDSLSKMPTHPQAGQQLSQGNISPHNQIPNSNSLSAQQQNNPLQESRPEANEDLTFGTFNPFKIPAKDGEAPEKRQNVVHTIDPATHAAVQECLHVYQGEIISTLNHYNDFIEERQVGAIALGCWIVCDFISTIRQRLYGPTTLSQRVANTEQRQRRAMDAVSMQVLAQKALIKHMQKQGQDISHIGAQLAQLPTLSVITSYVISLIFEKKGLLERLRYSIVEKRADMVTLGQLLSTTAIDSLHLAEATARKFQFLPPYVLRFELEGRVRAANTSIYAVHAFTHFVNVTSKTPYKLEYTGKTLVMKNQTANCIKGLDSTINQIVEEECTAINYRDPGLKSWRKTIVKDILKEPKHSQSVRLYPHIYVYCWGSKLFINGERETEVHECQLDPFELSVNQTFHTSDGLVSHVSRVGKVIHMMVPELDTDNTYVHLDQGDYQDNLTDLIYRQSELEHKAEIALETQIALRYDDKQLSWKDVFIYSASGVLIILIIIFLCKMYNKQRRSKNMTQERMVKAVVRRPNRLARPGETREIIYMSEC